MLSGEVIRLRLQHGLTWSGPRKKSAGTICNKGSAICFEKSAGRDRNTANVLWLENLTGTFCSKM